ncbi:Initiation-specific alpha-1,6-mannosyltransferase [Lachnellula subtilissima]|uniref:Initiation-specific alpha-1,6-mannosyltransferase n=1 Tax=Lachnellula subtilissima TaxID=602034 RepID=A0A8H8UJ04_9HELO|nr:Initiation-specific alpha-1,6-mannosyltransferase [Lachnellula subtilissima]
MLTFKRALIFAACILTVLFLVTRTNNNPTQPDILPHPSSDLQKGGAEQEDSTTKADDGSNSAKMPPVQMKPPGNGQQIIQDSSRATLREKLAYQFPYDQESKFPAYIWQTWKYTPASGEFGESFRPAEASWSEKHPGFIHEVITDQVAVHLLRHFCSQGRLFRYLILLARGGIYSDIDTYALKSATEWLPEIVPREQVGLVIGIEADPDREDWKEWYSRRIQFCQWTIQSKAGHPVLRETVAHITDETLSRKKAGTLKGISDNKVIEFTGPAVWTDTIFNFMNDKKYFDMTTSKGNITWRDFTGMKAAKKVGDVVVLPITSFSPGVQQMGAEDVDHPLAFVKHDFEGTWKPESLRHIGEQQQ